MLAGAWLLVLVPLMDVLKVFDLASRVPVPTVFDYRGTVRTLSDTFLASWSVYQLLVFCMGVMLLFSKERDRRRNPLDWTRRWGVLCTYIVLLIGASNILLIAALVLAGIAAVFLSMPLCIILAVAIWFSIAQFIAWGRKPPAATKASV